MCILMKVLPLQQPTQHLLYIMNMLHNQHLLRSKFPTELILFYIKVVFIPRVDDPYFVHVPMHLHRSRTNNQSSQKRSHLNVEFSHSDAAMTPMR